MGPEGLGSLRPLWRVTSGREMPHLGPIGMQSPRVVTNFPIVLSCLGHKGEATSDVHGGLPSWEDHLRTQECAAGTRASIKVGIEQSALAWF
jgi:hypothetical protein